MKEFIRLRCPFCGSMPYPAQIDNTDQKDPEVRIIVMKIGGKAPATGIEDGEYKKGGKGSGKGIIEYTDVTDQHQDMVEQYTQWFAARAVRFAEKNKLI